MNLVSRRLPDWHGASADKDRENGQTMDTLLVMDAAVEIAQQRETVEGIGNST